METSACTERRICLQYSVCTYIIRCTSALCCMYIAAAGDHVIWCCRILEENMVITVEPGCYFNPFLLGPAFESTSQGPFLNKRRLEGSMVGPACVAEPVAEQGPSMTLCSNCCIARPDTLLC